MQIYLIRGVTRLNINKAANKDYTFIMENGMCKIGSACDINTI